MEKKKALIGMSGGVDSSVAACLILKQGFYRYERRCGQLRCCLADDAAGI